MTIHRLIRVYADLQGLRSNEAPEATIPPALVTTPLRPDIVVYNLGTPSVVFTSPLDSEHNIQSARFRKQTRLNIYNCLQSLIACRYPTTIK